MAVGVSKPLWPGVPGGRRISETTVPVRDSSLRDEHWPQGYVCLTYRAALRPSPYLGALQAGGNILQAFCQANQRIVVALRGFLLFAHGGDFLFDAGNIALCSL
jgi:hypothetical protein